MFIFFLFVKMSMETVLVIIAVPLMNYLVNLLKNKSNLSGEISLVVMCFVFGLVYTGFQYAIPDVLQKEIMSFVSQVWLFAVMAYNFFLKKKVNE